MKKEQEIGDQSFYVYEKGYDDLNWLWFGKIIAKI